MTIMNAKTRTITTIVIVGLTFCLVSFDQSASAQSTNHCKKVKGQWVEFYPGTGDADFGTITNAGILDGTTETIFGSDLFSTPDPASVSFVADSTITTNRGVLKTHNVYVMDLTNFPPTGLAAALYRIDPIASTGIFAGATGVLNISAKVTDAGFTVHYEITGEICFTSQ